MKKYSLKRKENILLTAIDLYDEAGIHGVTTKEIANRQGITEPAIYRQFSSKKEIVLTMLEKFSEFDTRIKNTVLESNLNLIESITYFWDFYSEYYENYPQISTFMISYDVFTYDEETKVVMKKILADTRLFFIENIERAKRRKELSNDIESELVADLLMDIFRGEIYSWKVSDCKYSLKVKLRKIIDLYINYIR